MASQRAGARKGKARAAGSKGAAASSSRGRARTRRERFMDVETFWRSTTPKQRRELLRVPLGGLLEGQWAVLGWKMQIGFLLHHKLYQCCRNGGCK